ncbi:MAG: hypothetical protein LCH91_02645 [Bacteroidetes bacterium]|nr:hypothetical protein [Bacteroidota bacterium]
MKLLFVIIFTALAVATIAQNSPKASKISSPTKAQIEAIQSLLAPVRKQVEDILQKTDAKLFADYQADLKRIAALKNYQQRAKELTVLDSKYYTFVKQGYIAAKIDEKYYQSKMLGILHLASNQLRFTEFLGVANATASRTLFPPPSSPCKEFKCPLKVRNTTMNQHAIELSSERLGDLLDNISKECVTFAQTVALVASGRAEFSAIGEFASISSNGSNIDINAECRYQISGIAFAFLGGGYCDASVGIVVSGPNVDLRIENDSGWALAPVIWYNTFRAGGENDRLQGSFTPSPNGGDYKIQLYAKTYAMAAVLSGTYSNADIFSISSLKVCQHK